MAARVSREEKREAFGQHGKAVQRTTYFNAIYRDSLLQFSLCFHTFIALLIKNNNNKMIFRL
jgi:hypothetical protein